MYDLVIVILTLARTQRGNADLARISQSITRIILRDGASPATPVVHRVLSDDAGAMYFMYVTHRFEHEAASCLSAGSVMTCVNFVNTVSFYVSCLSPFEFKF